MRTIRNNRRATDSVSLGAVARGLEESASANVGAFLSPVEVRCLLEELKRLRVIEMQDFVRQVKAGDFTATNLCDAHGPWFVPDARCTEPAGHTSPHYDAESNYRWTVWTPSDLSAS